MTRSEILFEQALQYIPGGVNSPVRSFQGVDGSPVFFNHASGPYLFDEDNNRYIDYVGSWGPLILGHQDPDVIFHIREMLDKSVSFGAPTEIEIQLAQLICTHIPSIEQIRMVNSGTEAAMTAIRLARGFTQRDLIIKFEGCYHGHSDGLLIKAGSGALTLGQPSSAGVPQSIAEHTLNLEYNNITQLEAAFKKYGHSIAAVILEPVAANMGCVLPNLEFLNTLRDLCTKNGTLLIFDEVITGFRVSFEGAQGYYNIQPDLSIYGKIIGGGLPVGALGGKKEIMQNLAPVGPVYQAGTLSGNPLAMAAGLETLDKILSQPDFYDQLSKKTEFLVEGLKQLSTKYKIPMVINSICGIYGLFFTTESSINNFNQVMRSDVALFKRFYHGMLKEGIYLAPSAYESGFISIAHDKTCLEETLVAAEKVFETLK